MFHVALLSTLWKKSSTQHCNTQLLRRVESIQWKLETKSTCNGLPLLPSFEPFLPSFYFWIPSIILWTILLSTLWKKSSTQHCKPPLLRRAESTQWKFELKSARNSWMHFTRITPILCAFFLPRSSIGNSNSGILLLTQSLTKSTNMSKGKNGEIRTKMKKK